MNAPHFGMVLEAAILNWPTDVTVIYTRSSGGVPPNLLRWTVSKGGNGIIERIHQFPGPPHNIKWNAQIRQDLLFSLFKAFHGVDIERLEGPVADSPNEWFNITAAGQNASFSIVSLKNLTPDPSGQTPGQMNPRYKPIAAAIEAIIKAFGGEQISSKH